MGQLEQESRKRTRRKNLQKIILRSVAVAGVLSVALLAPNALVAIDKLSGGKLRRQKEFVNSSRKRLVKAGLLRQDKNYRLTLSPKGEAKLRQLELKEYKIIKPKRWDKKWRVLVFDIRENHRNIRDQLRHTLITVGFLKIQQSVWIYPYDCEDLITLVKADFGIGKEVLYMIVDSVEYDLPIKKHFGLEQSR
ncbi:MAG: hypothetical protein Q7R65_02430 [bacterium]|nr:hypothetical protein [bacterium]